MKIRSLNRWQAFVSHLLISVFIFLILLLVILFYWYPGLFVNMGGWQGIRLVAGVDLVLGPLLTLVIFNPKKKSLPLDLSAIAFLQFSCLAIGVWIVENQRPVAQILAHDGVYVVSKADIKEVDMNWQIFAEFKGNYPKVIFLELPNVKETMITTAVTASFTSGKPIEYHSERYLSPENVPKDSADFRLSLFDFSETNGCYVLDYYSAHIDGKACFNLAKGIVSLQ